MHLIATIRKCSNLLRLGLSRLRYYKFKHNFQDSLNPLSNCSLNTESSSYYLLHCPLFAVETKTFLSNKKMLITNS